jgi:hypothetical protein
MTQTSTDLETKKWCSTKLGYFLGFEDETLTNYILALDTPRELEEYLKGLLGEENHNEVQGFVRLLSEKLFSDRPMEEASPVPRKDDNSSHVKHRQTKDTTFKEGIRNPQKPRKICNCQGREHPPLTNCIECGRIACILEGTECLFCFTDLFANQVDANEKRKMAEIQRNKLLNFQETSAMRTRVIDDQWDFRESRHNQWLGFEEKKQRMRKEEQLRHLKLKQDKRSSQSVLVSIDVENRRFIEQEDESLSQEIAKLEEELKTCESTNAMISPIQTICQSVTASEDATETVEKSSDQDIDKRSGVFDKPSTETKSSSNHKRSQGRVMHDSGIFDNNYIFDDKDLDDLEVAIEEATLCICIKQPYGQQIIQGHYSSWPFQFPVSYRGLLWIATLSPISSASDSEKVFIDSSSPNENEGDHSFPYAGIIGYAYLDSCVPMRSPDSTEENHWKLAFSKGKLFKTPVPLPFEREGLHSLNLAELRSLKMHMFHERLDDPIDGHS